MPTMIADRIPVIDTDSHVSEPPDLWTSRLPSKWADVMPRVEHSEEGDEDFWLIGEKRVASAWANSMAGWKDYLPSHPRVQHETDPASYDPLARAQRLDEFGIRAQVLYPNVLGFNLQSLLALDDKSLHLACVQAYNDFLSEFAGAAPGRFIPVMSIPFWDLDESVKEIERCAAAGHKGILFANRPEAINLPRLRDPHWDPIWDTAQEAGLPINFHVGFGVIPPPRDRKRPEEMSDEEKRRADDSVKWARINFVKSTVMGLMSNAEAIVELMVSGLCERFPRLNFVSVESGFGYLPYLVEVTDWQWLNTGAAKAHPDREMPSHYFRRQVYGTFWFERESLVRMVDLFPDNVMFETDFPHPTSLSPGPASYTDCAKNVIEENLSGLPEDILRKLLHDNAARVYNLSDGGE